MRRLDAGSSGGITSRAGADVITSSTDQWRVIIEKLSQGRGLRPVQYAALEDARILESRQHLVVCAPTNSGKSLLGYVILLDAVLHGRRAILLEPLRALAQEQADELSDLLTSLKDSVFKQVPKVRISTGDYRLEGEFPSAAPPSEGEIIVATPERLDAILRNPEHVEWASSIGAMVVDEAHLLGDPNRGPTLELLIASMLSLKNPPRLALLSATLGDPELLREWLHPCQIISSTVRTPLVKEVWQLEDGDNPDDVLCNALRGVLRESENAALVFVYRRKSAGALAQNLSTKLGGSVGEYHSGLSASERARLRANFLTGTCRCLVATTALAMGVNLPATHVFVRDTTFFGFGRLSVQELLQILGRAGRGDRPGFGIVMLRPGDDWKGDELAIALRDEVLPPLRSSFDHGPEGSRERNPNHSNGIALSAATLVATCLARSAKEGLDLDGLGALLGHTLGGRSLASQLDPALRWLTDSSHAIAYRDEGTRYRLTTLGSSGVRAMLPLNYIAGVGQLIRDFISLDLDIKLLRRWSYLDHLLLAALLSDRGPKLRRFSEGLASQIDAWFESKPLMDKSVLFSEWVMGRSDHPKADELFGSLGIPSVSAANCRKKAYVSMLIAMVLDERSNGTSINEIERRWGLSGLDGVEESWRDTALWLLAGHASVFNVRSFYHHLRDTCSATDAQVRAVKYALGGMRRQAYDLLERLKYCSPLGPFVRSIRGSLKGTGKPTLGVGTIRRLEAAGVVSLEQIAAMDIDALVAAGVQQRYAKQIRAYIRRRLQ